MKFILGCLCSMLIISPSVRAMETLFEKELKQYIQMTTCGSSVLGGPFALKDELIFVDGRKRLIRVSLATGLTRRVKHIKELPDGDYSSFAVDEAGKHLGFVSLRLKPQSRAVETVLGSISLETETIVFRKVLAVSELGRKLDFEHKIFEHKGIFAVLMIDGSLVAFEAKNGKFLWQRNPRITTVGSWLFKSKKRKPIKVVQLFSLGDKLIWLNSPFHYRLPEPSRNATTIVCIDINNGYTICKSELYHRLIVPFSANGVKLLLYGADDGQLASLDMKSNEFSWKRKLIVRSARGVALHRNGFIVIDENDDVWQVDKSGRSTNLGAVPFKNERSYTGFECLFVIEDVLLGYSGPKLYNFTFKEGFKLQWQMDLDSNISSRPILMGNKLVVQTSNKVHCLDFKTGDTIWHRRQKAFSLLW